MVVVTTVFSTIVVCGFNLGLCKWLGNGSAGTRTGRDDSRWTMTASAGAVDLSLIHI